ncbi:MAG: hypothetical protein HOV67_26425 [Kribbellaceae bacterium]|nr:hypothetical protein [Kribbellaceae bacterium]
MTNTPSEGPATTGTRALTPDETLIAERVHELLQEQQARRDKLRQQAEDARRRSPLRRAGRVAPYAAIAAVGSQTPTGQQVVAAAGQAGEALGRGAADVGADIGHFAADTYNSAVEQTDQAIQATAHQIEQTAGDIAHGATDLYNSAVEQGKEIAGDIAHTATSAWDASVQGVQSAASSVSGWAVETWHSASDAVTTAAHAVGSWAAQYGDQIAAHPGNAAVTAGLGAAAVVAATPALRQGVGNALRAASRWAREAPGQLAQKGRELAVGVMLTYNNLRGIDANRGEPAKATHRAVAEVNALTGGDQQLPSVAEVREALAAPGSDPALAPAGGKQPEPAAQAGQGAQGQGAAERTGAVVDPKTKGGQSL